MQWALNSTEPALAKDLSKTLSPDLEQWNKTRKLSFLANEKSNLEGKTTGLQQGPDHVDAGVNKQMKAGIEAAMKIAAALGTADSKFNVTISGYFDPDHSDGIEERMVVAVDIAP